LNHYDRRVQSSASNLLKALEGKDPDSKPNEKRKACDGEFVKESQRKKQKVVVVVDDREGSDME